MSALPPKADMCSATRDVRFVPKADIGFLFDHVVGLRKQRWWDRYAERLSRFEIDHQLVLGWRLHGKIGGLLAFEDTIDVTRGTPVLVDKINAIGRSEHRRSYKLGWERPPEVCTWRQAY